MLPSRESFITALIHSKLSLRRIYRNWRRSTPPEKRVPVLAPDSSDPSADLNTRARRPAELPARPPDRNPLPLPLILAALFILALAVRLTNISYPPVVVFDEVHFLRFTRQYFYGEYFFDIHPPLGKLVLLTIIKLFCGPPKVKFNSNGASFGHQRYLPLRVTSAFFGAALSPLCYLISRELGLSVPASLFPAIVQAVEQLAVIESRLVLLDAQLMFWMAVCLLCALRMWGRKPLKRWPLVCATALSGSAAVSVKWTALATPGMIAIVSLIGAPFPAQRLALKEMGVAGGLAVSLYTVLFYIHFRLLPKSGDGDAFMKETFKATLIGNKLYDPKHRGPGFISNFLYLNYEMYIANKGIKTRHFWESKYWQWVLNKRGLLYYSEVSKADPTYHEKIYLIVNPAVTAVTCISLVICILMSAVWVIRRWRSRAPSKKRLERRRMHSFILRGAFLLSGYVFNLLPYVGKLPPSLHFVSSSL